MARPVVRTSSAQKASVGGLIVVALLILAVTIIMLGGEEGFWTSRFELKGRFTRISGLQTGAPVWLAGLKVGHVSEIEFIRGNDDSTYIDVTMRIRTDVKDLITKGSIARIGTLGLLGDKYVGITLGSRDKPKLNPGDYVETDNPIDFEELIGKGVETFNDLAIGGKALKSIATKIDSGHGTIGKMVNDPRMYFDIVKLLDITEKIEAKIANNEGTIGRLFNDPQLYDKLTLTVEKTNALMDSVESGRGTLGRFVNDPAFYDHLTRSLVKIDSLVAKIERGEGTTGKLISDDALYRHLDNTISTLDSLLKSIKENPKDYFKVKVSIF